MNKTGFLLVVSGPSGAGKGTICNALLKKYPDEYALSISATSREPRGNEQDGVEYFFKTIEEFEEMIAADLLLEHARYVDNYYGTPRKWVEEKLEEGINVILEIDYQGGFQVSSKIPNVLKIFIMPPDLEELKNRLVLRGTETEEQIIMRLKKAEEEIKIAEQYDYTIINVDVEKSVEILHNIVSYEKNKLMGEI
ncbi:MAG: guanylate kinase [Parasporobacterium sp.]|nr:guanylate kinase [Parasporobacterium sp.]